MTSLMDYGPAGCFQVSGKVSILSVQVQTALENVSISTDKADGTPWAQCLKGHGAVTLGAK